MTAVEQTLFGPHAVPAPRKSPEEAFDEFRRRHPWFMPRLAEMAFEKRSRGQKRLSMKLLFEELRCEVPDDGEEWRLNNSLTALAARRLVEMHPTLDGLFEFRQRRAG